MLILSLLCGLLSFWLQSYKNNRRLRRKKNKKTFQSAQSPLTFDLAEQVGVSTSVFNLCFGLTFRNDYQNHLAMILSCYLPRSLPRSALRLDRELRTPPDEERERKTQEMRICSTPTEQAADIYSMLNYKKMPFRKIKICRTQSP